MGVFAVAMGSPRSLGFVPQPSLLAVCYQPPRASVRFCLYRRFTLLQTAG